MYIQLNYTNLKEELNEENQIMLDKYLLENSLKYYYEKFDGDDSAIIERRNFEKIKTEVKKQISNNTISRTSEEPVVIISICSDPSDDFENSSIDVVSNLQGLLVGHHSWITVRNLTSSEILVGGLNLPALKTFSIGTWTGNIHDGIFYNFEMYGRDEFSTSESVYKSLALTQSQLNTLNYSGIRLAENDTWTHLNNCSSFAARMWNLNATTEISAGIIENPKNLASNILNNYGSTGLKLGSEYMGYYYGGANPIIFTPTN